MDSVNSRNTAENGVSLPAEICTNLCEFSSNDYGLNPTAPPDSDSEYSSADSSFSIIAEEPSGGEDRFGPEEIRMASSTQSTIENIPPASRPMVTRADPDKTEWMVATDWEMKESVFRQGDMVEFNRGFYSHYGVYLGNGLVVHAAVVRGVMKRVGDYSETVADSGLLFSDLVRSPAIIPLVSGLALTSLAVRRSTVELKGKVLEASPHPVPGSGSEKNYFIRIDAVLRVAGKSKFRVNNQMESLKDKYKERSFDEIFDLVIQHANMPFSFSLLSSNCEHYATYLRYNFEEPKKEERKKKDRWDSPPTDDWWN